MRSIMWRLADMGDGTPGPVRRAYGDDTITVTGLSAGAVVEVDQGDGVWFSGVVLGDASASPPNAFATNQWSLATGANPREITINVSVLPANGGAPITGIDYSIDGGAWVALDGAGTGPRTITAAAAGTSYSIRLRARNMSGASDPSAAKTVTSGAPAATAPAAFAAGDWTLTTGLGANELVLSVSALPSDGGSAITALQYQIGAGSWTALSGTGTGARTLTMAAPSTSYSINLRAVNAVGNGAASTAKTATSGAATVPGAFSAADWNVETRAIDGGATIRVFNLPPDNGSGHIRLRYTTNNGGSWTPFAEPAVPGDYPITLAQPDTVFDLRIGAVNGVGGGPQSDLKTVTSGVSPPAQQLTATLSPNPPVAGELLTITFSAAPDSATATLDGSAVTLAGTGTTRTITPATVGTLVVTFAKAGYTADPVTVEVQPAEVEPGGPSFEVIQQPDATFTVTADPDGGPILIDVTDPAAHAGQYTVDPADVEAQAPYWFASILAPASVVAGQPVTAIPGIWIADAAGGDVAVEIEWRDAGGIPIAGLTSLTLTGEQTLEHDGETLTVAMIATNSVGSRASTAAVVIEAAALLVDTFDREVTEINGETFESGEQWTAISGTGVRTNASGAMTSGVGDALYIRGEADRGSRQYVRATINRTGTAVWQGVNIGLCIAPGQGYFARMSASGQLQILRLSGTTNTTLIQVTDDGFTGDRVVELERLVDGTLNLYRNGVLTLTINDTTYNSGGCGVRSFSTGGNYLKDFAAGLIREEA